MGNETVTWLNPLVVTPCSVWMRTEPRHTPPSTFAHSTNDAGGSSARQPGGPGHQVTGCYHDSSACCILRLTCQGRGSQSAAEYRPAVPARAAGPVRDCACRITADSMMPLHCCRPSESWHCTVAICRPPSLSQLPPDNGSNRKPSIRESREKR